MNAHPATCSTLRSLAAAVLAVPVLTAVYATAGARSRTVRLVGVLAGAALAGTIAVSTSHPPSGAMAPRGVATPPPEAFTVVALPDDASAPGDAAPGAATFVQTLPTGSAGATAAAGARIVPTDRTGESAQATSATAPRVVRFRPRDGSSVVAPPLEVSVRFTRPMDRDVTAAAVSVTVDGRAWTGTARWAESDTVLVIRLERRLPAGADVNLAVSDAARATDGTRLATATAATFAIALPPPRPSPAPVTTARATPTPRPAASGAVASGGWSWPLIGTITQRFGQSLTKYGYHQGIDIDGDTGDAVRAAKGGRVTLAGKGDACGGIQVRVDHGGGIETWYRHLSALSVRSGQQVERGHVVGKVGNTGCSLGSHLHFAVRRSGTFVDPLRYLPVR